MPVTARLLQRLQETLGDEATNDLFAWWEHTVTVSPAEFQRMLTETRAGLESRISEVREHLHVQIAQTRAGLESRISEVRENLQVQIAQTRAGLESRISEVRENLQVQMAGQRADLIKWMFLFWAGTVIPLAGLMVALFKF